ncbi:helix-turn-helix transcriptional regulator [Roseofilum sp. BLCC_M91]|uniref:Helix-turn-helix transcriptional regulator n=1 Tax=Roseofilum halophilum BLCC-M91 TaxID=3022259 RepID=A0ABT7BM16_9CYAN|nr:helix-turn-helix transcriptional regulator [Roseofilum halophilum]MDJ1179318.1 helix-turn-helix transcriptional regulator [Roseofilum halophilum BLCC-M91]
MEKLRKSRCAMSQKAFAKGIGMSWRTYQDWMAAGKAPRFSPDQMKNLCEICNVDANTLLDFLTGAIDVEELPN